MLKFTAFLVAAAAFPALARAESAVETRPNAAAAVTGGDAASAWQAGRGNRAGIVQSGSGNTARIVQRGTGNRASITQGGSGGFVADEQLGDGHAAVVTQSGTDAGRIVIRQAKPGE